MFPLMFSFWSPANPSVPGDTSVPGVIDSSLWLHSHMPFRWGTIIKYANKLVSIKDTQSRQEKLPLYAQTGSDRPALCWWPLTAVIGGVGSNTGGWRKIKIVSYVIHSIMSPDVTLLRSTHEAQHHWLPVIHQHVFSCTSWFELWTLRPPTLSNRLEVTNKNNYG